MLRLVVLILVLMNGAYFAWTQGLLQSAAFAPEKQTEPERLTQQIKPGALKLLTDDELKQLLAPPLVGLRASECLQAGLFSVAQGEVLRSTLTANPEVGPWTLEAATEPARWIVFMGPYATADDLARKRAQLTALGLTVEPLINPELGLGWSLGRFPSQAAASGALEGFGKRGVRTARVVLERAEIRGLMLKINTTEVTVQAQLDALQPALASKALAACP
jgi:hypothetical protein